MSFYMDETRGRVGVLTTLPVKHAMCTLTNAMLRYTQSFLSLHDPFFFLMFLSLSFFV